MFFGLEIGRIGWWSAFIAFAATSMLAIGYYVWFHMHNDLSLSNDPEVWAQFGDYLAGTAGPIIGFASIMLLVETLRLQQRGLKEQREQLQRSAKEIRQQNRILSQQSFEQTFFGWLRDYKGQISYLTFSSDTREPQLAQHETAKTNILGIKALVSIAHFLMNKPIYDFDSDQKTEGEYTVAQLLQGWKAIQELRGDTVQAAIRSLYGIIKWVDQQESLSDTDKLHYISIIRAQLTDSELILLFVNGLTDRGQKFVYYINKYALLDNLVVERYTPIQTIQLSEGISPYNASAFNTDRARKELDLRSDA